MGVDPQPEAVGWVAAGWAAGLAEIAQVAQVAEAPAAYEGAVGLTDTVEMPLVLVADAAAGCFLLLH